MNISLPQFLMMFRGQRYQVYIHFVDNDITVKGNDRVSLDWFDEVKNSNEFTVQTFMIEALCDCPYLHIWVNVPYTTEEDFELPFE